jgi:hypothetical protein
MALAPRRARTRLNTTSAGVFYWGFVVAIISSIQDIYTYAQIATPTQAQTAEINLVWKRVEDAVEQYLGWQVEKTQRTVYLPKGTHYRRDEVAPRPGRNRLRLPHRAIRSLNNGDAEGIYEDIGGHYGQRSSSKLTYGEDYYMVLDENGLCQGEIYRATGSWCTEPGSIKCVYTAGYSSNELGGCSTVPGYDASAIQLACLQAVSDQVQQLGIANGATSYSLGEFQVKLDDSSGIKGKFLSERVREMLAPWKRIQVLHR